MPEENSNILRTKLKLQVRLSIQSLYRYTAYDIKISTCLKKMGDEAEAVQCPFK